MKVQVNIFNLKNNSQKKFFVLTTLCVLAFFGSYIVLFGGKQFVVYISKLLDISKAMIFKDNISYHLIMKESVIFPSDQQYNLSAVKDSASSLLNISDAFSSYIAGANSFWVDALFAIETFVPKKGRRQFLEYNAGDGVTNSGTLHLEKFLEWTGVLIEANKTLFEVLKHVQRKAYVINSCPSSRYIKNTRISPNSNENTLSASSCQTYSAYESRNGAKNRRLEEVPCLSIPLILRLTNTTKIDLFILKVRKNHLQVLKTIPYESIEISFFAIEVTGVTEKNTISLHMFIDSSGYVFYDKFKFRHVEFSMFILKKYYLDEDVIRNRGKDNPLNMLQILTGSYDVAVDAKTLEEFVMFNNLMVENSIYAD